MAEQALQAQLDLQGVKINQLGFGTAAIGQWQQDDDYVKDTIKTAIKAGFRHLDTASIYGNERSVGKAIAESGIPRDEFFITSKVWDTQQGLQQTLIACEESLLRLGTDYLDLYLIHWPVPELTVQTWRALEQLKEQGKVRAIGLSNFRKSDIEHILAMATHKPVYNQLELHPYFQQKELVAYCQQHGIAVSAWSPLGTGSWSSVAAEDKPLANPTLQHIAQKHGVSTADVIIRWNLQQGRIVIPKAESAENIHRNANIPAFMLSQDDLQAIEQLDKNTRFGADPDTAFAQNSAMRVPA